MRPHRSPLCAPICGLTALASALAFAALTLAACTPEGSGGGAKVDASATDPDGATAGLNLWLYDLSSGAQRPITRQGLPYI
jgi:hypothetical protein